MRVWGCLLSAVIFAQNWVGLTWEAAKQQALDNGVPIRVVERDGVPLPVTKDYVINRVNVKLKDNVVVDVSVEGQS